jgi:hypothetical protein
MKKLIYLFAIIVVLATLSSCGSKKKGCGLTSDINQITIQEIVVADLNE